ncbi:MAG: hypothetical protein JW741_25110 [Sedimentisphaerales bacterium]|nr:hypothetical protein [Sedimentisphaerales bacterium]
MTREQRLRFIDEELKGLWPQWEPSEAEIRLWMNLLAGFDFVAARQALHQCFCTEAGNYRRPRPGPFLARARALCLGANNCRRRPPRDLTTNVYIECRVAPADRPHVTGWRMGVYVLPRHRQSEPDYVWACAQEMRKRCQQIYGGQWIAARDHTPEPRDDNLHGPSGPSRLPAGRGADSTRAAQRRLWPDERDSADIELEQTIRCTYA